MISGKNSKKEKQPPLTLEVLVKYNQDVLFPYLHDNFSTKADIKNFVTKDTFSEFRNETTNNFDSIFKKLDILISEKEMREYYNKKEKKLWAIVLKSLEKHKIITDKEIDEIRHLEFF